MSKKDIQIKNISGVDCYEKDGTVYLKLETVARGLGFTRIAKSGNKVVMWSRVEGYLEDLGVHTSAHDDFIPENIFYRLAMKAKNETAEKFQAKVADEIIPAIRKTGGYVNDDEVFINTYLPFADDATRLLSIFEIHRHECRWRHTHKWGRFGNILKILVSQLSAIEICQILSQKISSPV